MPYYHLFIEWKDWRTGFLTRDSKVDLDIDQLTQFVDSIKSGSPVFFYGWRINADDVWHFQIWKTDEREQGKEESSWDWIGSHGKNVTNDFVVSLSPGSFSSKTTVKEKMAVGNISNFFGVRFGSMSFDKVLKSYGLENAPRGNKTERLSGVLRHLYNESRTDLPSFLNMLISRHKLDTGDLEELNSYLVHLGYRLDNRKVIEIPAEEDFFKFFMESLEHPRSRPAVEGARDGAIITLCEKINGMTQDFTLVDYGCGEGRLVYGLSLIDEKALSKMSYVGVDKNPDYLKSIEETIKKSSFDKKVKSYSILSPKEFFETKQVVDFIFLINVLHEIPLLPLTLTLTILEWRLRKGGHIMIHEMRELAEGEMGFVSWEPEDLAEAFESTSLEPHIHPYETKSGISLVNVDLVKVTDEKTKYESRHSRLYMTYLGKLQRVEHQLSDIKEAGIKNRRYASLLVLKDNIETQIQEYTKHREGFSEPWG